MVQLIDDLFPVERGLQLVHRLDEKIHVPGLLPLVSLQTMSSRINYNCVITTSAESNARQLSAFVCDGKNEAPSKEI
jgi:hypothetical protein